MDASCQGKLLDKKAEALAAGRVLTNSATGRPAPLSTSVSPNIASTSPTSINSSSPGEGKSGIKKVKIE